MKKRIQVEALLAVKHDDAQKLQAELWNMQENEGES